MPLRLIDRKVLSAIGTAVLACASAYAVEAPQYTDEHIYINTNDVANKVIHFRQAANGELVEQSRLPTRGLGTGGDKPITGQSFAPDPLVSAGAIEANREDRLLFVVNAGENTVSSFHIDKNGELRLADKKPTGENGLANTLSYDPAHNLLFVGHSFGPNHIRVFRVEKGKLVLLPKRHTVNVSDADDRVLTQVRVAPSNRFLLANVVYDKRPSKNADGKFDITPANTRKDALVVFKIQPQSGGLSAPAFQDAGANAPFGMSFVPQRGDTFVNSFDSPPGGAILGQLDGTGKVSYSPLAKVQQVDEKGEAGTCWVSFSPDGRFAYVAAFDTGSISSFQINGHNIQLAKDGLAQLKPTDLSNDPASKKTGTPVGNWATRNGYLYQLYPSAAKVAGYRMQQGELEPVGTNSIPLNSTQGITGVWGL